MGYAVDQRELKRSKYTFVDFCSWLTCLLDYHLITLLLYTLMKSLNNLWKWEGHEFSSWSTNWQDFNSFARNYKAFIKDVAKELWGEIVAWNKWHYECSWFIKVGDKFIYLNCGDVRWWARRREQVLMRTATHPKDYTWWANNYTHIDDMVDNIKRLLSRS